MFEKNCLIWVSWLLACDRNTCLCYNLSHRSRSYWKKPNIFVPICINSLYKIIVLWNIVHKLFDLKIHLFLHLIDFSFLSKITCNPGYWEIFLFNRSFRFGNIFLMSKWKCLVWTGLVYLSLVKESLTDWWNSFKTSPYNLPQAICSWCKHSL